MQLYGDISIIDVLTFLLLLIIGLISSNFIVAHAFFSSPGLVDLEPLNIRLFLEGIGLSLGLKKMIES